MFTRAATAVLSAVFVVLERSVAFVLVVLGGIFLVVGILLEIVRDTGMLLWDVAERPRERLARGSA